MSRRLAGLVQGISLSGQGTALTGNVTILSRRLPGLVQGIGLPDKSITFTGDITPMSSCYVSTAEQ